jgi:multicomponent Na+:H+ antiporter subunit D
LVAREVGRGLLLGVAAAISYTMHTMLVQTGLFGAGAIAPANRGYDLRAAGGLMHDHPVFAALFAFLVLSISGVPLLSGFWAEFLVIDAAFRIRSLGSAWLGRDSALQMARLAAPGRAR